MNVEDSILKNLMNNIFKLEKEFLNERQMSEIKKIKKIKDVIEKEVKCNEN